MNALNSKNNVSPPTKIPLALARERVKLWLKHMLSIKYFKKHPDQIPRALYIPIDDLKQFLIDYPENTAGARIYFGLEQLVGPGAEGKQPIEVKGMMVPVLKGSQKDEIYNPASEEETYIYDFTTPCPRYCDTDSELYVVIP